MTAESAYEMLRGAFTRERPAQAYLLIGPPRTVGRALVERLLKGLYCEGGGQEPCDECRGCRLAGGHSHPDLLWVEPQKKSRRIGVDEIRAVQTRVYETSMEGGWRACVIVGADRLTVEAANAFLKTLEEPPARCVMFLLSNAPEALLPTIQSRCQRLSVEGAEEELSEEHRARLVKILSAGRKNNVLMGLAQADALHGLLAQVKAAIEQEEKEAAAEDPGEDEDTPLTRASARYREKQAAIMRFVQNWYRDLVMLLCDGDDYVYNTGCLESLQKRAAGLSLAEALEQVRTVESMHRRLERNVSEKPVLGWGFVELG